MAKAAAGRRIWPLIAGGLVCEIVYLAAAIRLPWWRYGGYVRHWSVILGAGWGPFFACLAGAGVLFAAYLWGWRAVRQGRATRPVVWAWACLFAATLFWLLPITSDLFGYLVQAHLLTDLGLNPLLVPPLDALDSRLVLAYVGPYANLPSAYGPAWTLLSAPATLGTYDVPGGLLYLKWLAAAAFLGTAWLVERILRDLRPADALEGLYLFAWNPLILFMAVGDGHNDVVMMVLALLAVWLLYRERWVPAFGLLALSIWIKYASVILLPLFLIYAWRRWQPRGGGGRWSILAQSGLVVTGVSVLVFLPLGGEVGLWGILDRFLHPANWQRAGSGWFAWGLGLGILLFGAAYLALAWRLALGEVDFQRLANAGFVAALLVFVLGAVRTQPWHLIWPAALAGLSDRRWVWPVVVSLAAAMFVAQFWVEWGTPGLAP